MKSGPARSAVAKPTAGEDIPGCLGLLEAVQMRLRAVRGAAFHPFREAIRGWPSYREETDRAGCHCSRATAGMINERDVAV